MNAKMLILSIGVITVGLFAMPSTVSLVTGQHTFIDYSDNTSTASCQACHPDVQIGGDAHESFGIGTQDDSSKCRGCHTVGKVNGTGLIPANWSTTDINQTALWANGSIHIAAKPSCTVCHDMAKAGLVFNVSDVHRPLYLNATTGIIWNATSNVLLLPADDRACYACHTAAGIKNGWTEALGSSSEFWVNVTKIPGTDNYSVNYTR